MKMPNVGDSVRWTILHSGNVYRHSGIVQSYFEKHKKVYAIVKENGRLVNVHAGRISLAVRSKLVSQKG